MNITFTGTYTLKSGLNTFTLTTPVTVSKGALVLLKQTTGKVSVDQSGTAIYSDMMLLTSILTKLSSGNNWRFFFNTIDDLTVNLATITFTQAYAAKGTYTMTLTSTKNSAIYQTSVIISECNIILNKNLNRIK